MIKLVLRLFDALSWLIRAFGADYPQFRAILETKLILDTRRMVVGAVRSERHSKARNGLVGTLVFYGLMGLFISFTTMTAGSPLVGMTIVYAFVMTMVGLSLVADFSSVLLDTTDNAILQPRPVGSRTIFMARIAHIVVYLSLLSLSLSLPTIVGGTFKWGLAFPPVFILTLVCAVSLVICAVNLFYVVAIRLTSGERLRDIILYFQVVMSIAVVAGYQLLPRLMDMTALRKLRIEDRWWIYVFPPTWMAAPIDLLAGNIHQPQLILSAMAITLPLIGLIVVSRGLGPRFSSTLATLDAAPVARRSGGTPAIKRSPARWLGKLVCRTPVGEAAFEVVWMLCSRDRQFKLRTYPSLAFIFVFPAFFLIAGHPSVRQALVELPNTQKHLFVLYMAGAMLPSMLINLRFGDNWQAAWIYTAMPIARPGDVFAAATKALTIRFVLPAYAVVSAATMALWGARILPDIALAGCTTLMMCSLQSWFFGRRFPFSEAFGVTAASGRASRSMLLLLIPMGLGGLHYLLTFAPFTVFLMIPVVLLVAAGLFRAYARTSWQAVED